MQHAGGEGVPAADAVDDAWQSARFDLVQLAVAGRHQRAQRVRLDAVLGTRGTGDARQPREGLEGAAGRAGEALGMGQIRLRCVRAQHHVHVAVVGEGDLGAVQQRPQQRRRVRAPGRP